MPALWLWHSPPPTPLLCPKVPVQALHLREAGWEPSVARVP